MNVENKDKPLGRLYLEVLKTREGVDSRNVPYEKVFEALSGSLDKSLKMIKDLALLSASLDSNLTAVFQKLDRLAEDPEIGPRLTEEFQDLVALKSKVIDSAYLDAADFARKFEKMVRDSILRQSGIDPSNEEASMAYLLKLGKSVVLAETNPSN